MEAVIFDFDGVIFESANELYQGYKHCLKKFGIDYSEEAFSSNYELRAKEHFNKVLIENNVNLSNEELVNLVLERDVFYRKLLEESKLELLPGVKDLLLELKENKIRTSIATATHRKNLGFL